MWRCDNVGGLGEHVKNTCCGLLGIPFLFKKNFFCFILRLAPSPHQWTDFDDLYMPDYASYDVFPLKDVPFGGLVHTAPHFEGTILRKPLFWGA